MLLGGSDLCGLTKLIQTMSINVHSNTFELVSTGTTQKMEYARLNAAVCLMDTDNANEKIALVFGGLEEHEPILSIDGVRIKYEKTQIGEEMTPFFVYDDIQVGSYRLLLRESANNTY